MNYRNITLLSLTASFADNRTIVIDLNMSDPISEIYLDIRATNGSVFPTVGHPMQTVTKVEIVDGSDVLFSLDGLEVDALDYYHSGQCPRGQRNTYEALQEYNHIMAISFGRFLFDEQLALDPTKFQNAQLKITFDYDAGGMTPSAAKLKVVAAIFDEKTITPVGFLMTKEVKRWTSVAAAHEYTDLPTDYPYRKLLLQGRLADNPPNWVFGNIKISSDQDKKVIINNEFLELISGMCRENAFMRESYVVSSKTTNTHLHITPTLDVVAAATIHGVDIGNYACCIDGGDGGYMGYKTQAQFAQDIIVTGSAPHGTLAIPFGKQDVIEDWFDVAPIGSLKADITDGVADCTSKIFIQQLRKYA